MAYAGHTLGVRPPLRRQVAPTCVSLAVLLAALIPAISARVMAQAPDDRPARDAAELADVEDSLAHDPSYKVRVDAALVLGRLRQPHSVPALIAALGDAHP